MHLLVMCARNSISNFETLAFLFYLNTISLIVFHTQKGNNHAIDHQIDPHSRMVLEP